MKAAELSRARASRRGRAGMVRACVALACVALTCTVAPARAQPPAAGAAASSPVVSLATDTLRALRKQGDAARGAITFETCQGCHRTGGQGRPDGSYPRLAGQHDTVLIKQMTDIRARRRVNPRMLPFIDEHVADPQDIADIAAFLARQPLHADNGRGPGDADAATETLYRERCLACHGAAGDGDSDRLIPRVNGQHYRYTLRQLRDIRDHRRANADDRMAESVADRSDAQLEALADLLSRMPVPPAR